MTRICIGAAKLTLAASLLHPSPAPAEIPLDSSLVSALPYGNIGPFRMQARIADIDILSHPEKDHLYTMYVAPWVGGVFKTTDGRKGWQSVLYMDEKVGIIKREPWIAETDLGNLVRKSPAWRGRDDVFQSVPGVRQALSFTLLSALCALGRLSGSEIAKPVRIAPLNRDWGTLKGRRFKEGGGASVRMVLYMGALMATKCTPVIRFFCQRPITAGKPRSSP